MPVPAVASVAVPLIPPLTVSGLVKLFVQVWLPPRMTGALIVLAPDPARTVMPLPRALPFKAAALIVSEFAPVPEAIVAPAPVKARLLIVKFCSSVVLRFVAEFAAKMTFVLLVGSAKVSGLPFSEVDQFVVEPTVSVFHLPSACVPCQ